MTGLPPRGGVSGKSVAPRKTVYKDKGVPPMWKAFCDDLRSFRENKGMTPNDLAEALGVSVAKIYLWEAGKTTPHPYDLCVLLGALGAKRIVVE